MTELSLDISKTNDLKIMRLFDTSNYQDDVIENYLIEVLPVNKNSWVTFRVHKDFSLVLNSSNLQYKVVGNKSELTSLPDGVYEIKQSYKPNSGTSVHYYHLRTTEVRLKFIQMLCRHFSEECKKEKRQYAIEIEKLNKIRDYIDVAEFSVCDSGDKELGIKFYNKAVELLKQFDNECKC